MMNSPQTLWLTGASSGIGLALAHALQDRGHRLIVSGRNADTLRPIVERAPATTWAAVTDTTNPASMADAQTLWDQHGPLQMAILNAGTCEYVDVDQFDASIVERNMHTNFGGTVRSVAAVLPALRAARKQGLPAELVIVSSSAWWFPFGRAEGYGASKAALTYFAHSLRADLAAEGIGVTVVSPGFVKTPLTDRNDFPMPFIISAEEAAKRIVRGLEKGRKEIHFPRRFTWTLKLLGALPQRWIDAIAARMSRNQQESR
ncbi:MAG: SDR family NAD(P)-dependent oxidoreductase [Marinobacter sp.]|nr:SDR family NAD(P)-dependent oxidoreductase [Marinobacter sp.]